MPTLASVHSKQATISVKIQPAQLTTASDMGLDRLDRAESLQLEHTNVHLLLCPWQAPLQQALKALAGNKKAAQAFGEESSPWSSIKLFVQ